MGDVSRFPAGGKQFSLFDERPLELEGFTLRARRAEPVGTPTLRQWANAMQLAFASEESSPFWIGDLWNYAETRPEWRQKLPQALATIGLDVKIRTIYNHGSIARRVSSARARAAAPSLSHCDVVAALEEDDQVELLEKANREDLTKRDLQLEVKQRVRPKVLESQARLEGMYRVIYADPPWLYGDRQASGSSSQRHYPVMTIADLCKLPVAAHALPDSVLFLWTTAPLILQNPGPRDVIEAWGFTPKTGRVWDKVKHGFGHYVEVRHEHLIICTRGSCLPDRLTPMLPSVVTERRSDVHSEKPESFRQDIERLYDGPYLELFGRKRVTGWDVFGNDARLWARDKAASA